MRLGRLAAAAMLAALLQTAVLAQGPLWQQVEAESANRLTDDEVRMVRQWLVDQEAKSTAAAHSDVSRAAFLSDQAEPSPMSAGAAQDQKSGEAQFDPQLVSQGQSAFTASCTSCHDAERSTGKQKSLAGWVATVERMAAKDGADVASGDVRSIATYLASLNPTGSAGDASGGSSTTVFGTVSLIHRSGPSDALENKGFFPEVWLGAEWRSGGAISGRVQACVTCHTENASVSGRIELAEGIVHLDVDRWLYGCDDACVQTSIDGGRLIVPFGAFAAKSHAGAFRTATRPLMYNMGQNVYRDDLGAPLLPMPYSDEGAAFHVEAPVVCDATVTVDGYAINGLQGSTALDLSGFYVSRDYVDNNSEPAVGGRVTLGNQAIRGGASIMSGRFNSDAAGGFPSDALHYKIYGADLTARYGDRGRVTLEYARRTSDLFDFTNGVVGEDVKGVIVEGEWRIWNCPKVSAVVRYDDQRRTDGLPIPGSAIATGGFSVRRFTYGLNIDVAGSTLMINHERWNVPAPLDDLDVLAIRWVGSF
jgi:mono/diheme cytochrome c family protein